VDPAAGDEDPLERVLDLLVYAPIGLVLDFESLEPDLASRGRRHAAAARQIGEMAVKSGLRRVDEAVDRLVERRDTDRASTSPDAAGPAASGDTADEPGN
jgi:hypothetical protein